MKTDRLAPAADTETENFNPDVKLSYKIILWIFKNQ